MNGAAIPTPDLIVIVALFLMLAWAAVGALAHTFSKEQRKLDRIWDELDADSEVRS